ncbi:MAG: DUF4349 domain-containing protein [Armatimonadota bacterium]
MNHRRPTDDTACPSPEIAADLKAYLDNELSLLRRRTIASHLRQCAACREEITAMTTITDGMKSADTATPAAALDPAMRHRLLSSIAAETSTLPTARTLPLWRRKPLLVFGGGAAYVGVFLILAAVLFPTFGTSRERARRGDTVAFGAQSSAPVNGNGAEYSEDFASSIPGSSNGPRAALQAGAPPLISGTLKSALEERAVKPSSQDVPLGLVTERQVHREGSVTVSVDKLEAASEKVEQAVKASGGFVASNNLNTDGSGYKSADLTVRVPVAQFDDMFKQFAALGNVTAKSISGEDITERMSDATQAEQVLRESAEATARKLRNNGGSEKEIRYREADLRRVRIELAQTQARLGLLRKMARLATINVSLTEKAKKAAETPVKSGFLGDMSETNRMASAAFASAVRVPVVLIIWVLAFSPLWVPMTLLYRYASRRSAAGTKLASIDAP